MRDTIVPMVEIGSSVVAAGYFMLETFRNLTADQVSHGGPASMAAIRHFAIWFTKKLAVSQLVRSPVVALLAMSIDRT